MLAQRCPPTRSSTPEPLVPGGTRRRGVAARRGGAVQQYDESSTAATAPPPRIARGRARRAPARPGRARRARTRRGILLRRLEHELDLALVRACDRRRGRPGDRFRAGPLAVHLGRHGAVPWGTGATSSSPVDSTATFGRRTTLTLASPLAASMPISREPMRIPRRSKVSPRAMSEPAKDTNCPGPTVRRNSIAGAGPSSNSVCSIMMTASAPRGSTPPVAMAVAVPGATSIWARGRRRSLQR